ncbi:hypothetical protein [Roseateles terrae]|uniref:SepL/TyeA/HrpJ family type III secretion system gatekeeper n=1 Tax=Roseateles terrae TaxID=431060 RepID=A0ABR6GQQ0_9BURK|nr:hypothetical protein [Roseateles terrae]MBB3194447.1 hypothetical protein [Roseateles terrae]OWQ88273.1 hypothetical protein CDN98_09125 [Roseateles terrae]
MALSPTLPAGLGMPLSHEAPRLPDADVSRAKAAEMARQAQQRRAAAAASLAQPLQMRPPSAGLGVEAFEEITFQASEREEAELHETLHDEHVRDAELVSRTLPVEKVVAVMRMMEGQYGYQLLRTQARIFARDFETDPHGALERLKLAPHRPEARLAVMRLAEDLIEKTRQEPEAVATVQALRQLEQQDADQIRHLIKVYDATRSEHEAAVATPNSSLIQLLASPMSTRVLLEAVGSPEGLKTLSRQLNRLPQEGHFDSPATFVGLSVALSHMLSVIRTMDDHATQLGKDIGLAETEQPKVLRQLMDLCRTAAPKPKLEKMRSDLLKQVGPQQSVQFDQSMLKQVSQYPESVWIHIEAKTAVQSWLRDAQGLHFRRQGVLGPTGQLNRDVLGISASAV